MRDQASGRGLNKRRLSAVSFVLILSAAAIHLIVRQSEKKTQSRPINPALSQALLIERKGIQELSAENNVPANTLSPEDKKLGEAVMNTLSTAGDGKDTTKLQQARAATSNLIKKYPDYAGAYALRATYSLMSHNPDLRQIESDIDAALKYHYSHKYDNYAFPSDVAIYSLRAKVDMLAGDYQQAMTDLESAIKINPSSPNEIFNTGSVKPSEDTNPTALQRKDLDILVSTYSHDYRAYMFRGLFYAGFTTYDEQYYSPTFADLNRALALNSNSALVHYFLGTIAQKMTFWTQAAARDISEITKATGGYKEKLHEKALQHFLAAVKLDSAFAGAYVGVAEELYDLKRYSEAILYYDKVIQLESSNSGAYNDRGLAKTYLGQYYDAINDFSQAIALRTSESGTYLERAYENRAEAYAKTHKYGEAVEDYSRAIGLSFREQVFLMSIDQIRSIYPELSDIPDGDLLEGLREKYFPNMSPQDFNDTLRKNKQFDLYSLAGLYERRAKMYLAARQFRKAAAEYARSAHSDKDYISERWEPIYTAGVEYSLDIQTLDFSKPGMASFWLKGKRAHSKYYTEENYHIDCSDRKIKSLFSAQYDGQGNILGSSGEQNWQGILPESLGEFLYNGMCQ